MDPDKEIQTDWPPYFRQYKSGRFERLMGTAVIPASIDPTTGVTSKDITIHAQQHGHPKCHKQMAFLLVLSTTTLVSILLFFSSPLLLFPYKVEPASPFPSGANPITLANPITIGGSQTMDPKAEVAFKDETINPGTGIAARLYLPAESEDAKQKKLPVLIYFHGGGFIGGSVFIPMWHDFISSLSSRARLLTVSVEYRLAPEHRLPAAYDDSWTALRWVLSRSDPWLAKRGDIDRLFVSGDSVGANIAHQLVMRLGDEHQEAAAGLVLIDPFFWGTKPLGQETEEAREKYDRMLSVAMPAAGMEMDDPRINPIAEGAPSLARLGCRRVMVCVAGDDELVDRGRTYYSALKASRWEGEAEMLESEGEGHDFNLLHPQSKRALERMANLVAFFLRSHCARSN